MFKIDGKMVGGNARPYIIAEMSANHGGDIDRAKKTINAAKAAGADAVKMQTYTPDTMTLECDKEDFLIPDGLWKGYTLYQLYKEAHTPYEWHRELFEYAREVGITIFSSPFDETAVDLLEELNTPAYKIASFELTDTPLIEYVASKGKPVLLSTGMSTMEEIASAVECCKKAHNSGILLFHCISSYPADLTEARLGAINYLKNHFQLEVGLSDHTISNKAAQLSIALGAKAIEKHFKPDNEECGPDSSFSILPDQLRDLVEDCDIAHQAIESDGLERSGSEKFNRRFRRSLYFTRNLKSGHVVTESDIKRVRPGFGLAPGYFDQVVGMTLSASCEKGDPVSWDRLSKAE